ncbi:MAG: poly-gamma-glutamate synthase PgsB [Clostridiales bacterium]|nr:poly-gamma-glutamate synthase PgsB [Clostridiales bacterium]
MFLAVFYFFVEQHSLARRRGKIRLRIAVTGTRGKSTVTRLMAAALREARFSVLAKTTGSKPVLIFPDGREEEIKRRGNPTILEAKKILKKGASLGVGGLVVEMMSIQPECARVESCRILRPHILVITNVRLDHREEQGQSKPEIAASLASAVPPHATVFLPEEELRPEFEAAATKVKAKIISVRKEISRDVASSDQTPWPGFEENIRLTLAVTDSLGIPREIAWRGIRRAEPDFGSLKAWQVKLGRPPATWTLVSAFAANEPESTAIILSHLQNSLAPEGRKMIGILNFRKDRGDRSLQWLEACRDGFFSGFERLYVVGAHVHSLKLKKLARANGGVVPLTSASPRAVMERITADEPAGAVLIGMGNMGGLGVELVKLWEEKGKPYGL